MAPVVRRPLLDRPGPKIKRRQHCTLCKNHGHKVLKNGHVCKLKSCKCELCKLTTKAQIAMRHQQALWRHQGRELAKDTNFQMLGLTSRQVRQVPSFMSGRALLISNINVISDY